MNIAQYSDQPYLHNAVKLLAELEQLHPNSCALIAGGSVRDLLLKKVPTDIDIATNVPIEKIVSAFSTHDIGKSKDFGIVVVEYGGFTYEVAQFRKDGTYSDNRHPDSVTIIDNFKEDSSRRDFTINSLGLNQHGEVINYHGGIVDLNNKLIKTVGDPLLRFTEDAIRILRAARFGATLKFNIEPNTFQAMSQCKHLLAKVSKERIAGELYKAAKTGPSLAQFVKYLDDTDILRDILPEVHAFKPFVHNIKHHPEGGGTVFGHVLEAVKASRSENPVVNLGVLFHDLGKATTYKNREGKHTYYGHEHAGVPIIQGIAERLKFSSDDTVAMQFAAANHMLVHKIDELSVKTLIRLIHDINWNILKDVSYADEASRGAPLFSSVLFAEKITAAEDKVQKLSLGKGELGLKIRVKQHVDGNKLLQWIPELKEPDNKRSIGKVLQTTQEWILDKFDKEVPFIEDEVIGTARESFNKLAINSSLL